MNPLIAGIAVSIPLMASALASSVIVNEINAGGATVLGDWFELVVVGDGTPSSTVDLRGWTLRVDNNGTTGVGRFTLSENVYWSTVRAGTILTFHENDSANNGVDTAILATNHFSTLGWAHTNIWAGDSTYVNTAAADYDGNFPIDEKNSQVVILDRSQNIVFGPAGEGHVGYGGGGVSASEVFKLEADPSTLVTLTSPYKDGSTHTFGAPNGWTTSGFAYTQNFSAFVPEPSSALLAVFGGCFLLRRRRGIAEG